MQQRLTIILLAAAVFLSMPIHYGSADSKGKPKAVKDTKMASAQEVMKNVRQLANVYEKGGHLVVEFHEYLFPYDINKRLQFVRAVADADCVIKGKPRLIFFYNPDGRQIAQADPTNGIRLKDQ